MALLDDPYVHQFTTDEFLELAPYLPERVELVDGVIYDVGEETAEHARIVMALIRALLVLRPDFEVLAGGTVRLRPRGAPIPDVAVYRPGADTSSRYFQASDMLLAVEVSLSTASRDRRKLADYARAGIPEVWVIDKPIEALRVQVYTLPDTDAGSYGGNTVYYAGLADLAVDQYIRTF